MSPDSNQIHIYASSRGIVDHFFCFTCDEYVWDCDHLIDERLDAPTVRTLEPSQLQSLAYYGRVRLLEIGSRNEIYRWHTRSAVTRISQLELFELRRLI